MARRPGAGASAYDRTQAPRALRRTRGGARFRDCVAGASCGYSSACGQRSRAPDWRGAAAAATDSREALRSRLRKRSARAHRGVACARASPCAAGSGSPRRFPPFAQPHFAGAISRRGANCGDLTGCAQRAARSGPRCEAHRGGSRRSGNSRSHKPRSAPAARGSAGDYPRTQSLL